MQTMFAEAESEAKLFSIDVHRRLI